MNKMDILNYLVEHKQDLQESFNLTKIGLFGSFAKGIDTENSDIDILIEFKENTDNLSEIKRKLKNKLSKDLHRNVDLCREKYLKNFIRNHIISETIYV